MSDPVEKLLLRQPLAEPPASLDRRVRRCFLERRARQAWRRWRWPAAAAASLAALVLGAVLIEAWRGGRNGPIPDDPNVATAGSEASDGEPAVIHVASAATAGEFGGGDGTSLIISEDASSCCVTDLTGDVPIVYCFAKNPYSPLYVESLAPEL